MIGLQSLQGRAHSSDGRVHTHLNFEPGRGKGEGEKDKIKGCAKQLADTIIDGSN